MKSQQITVGMKVVSPDFEGVGVVLTNPFIIGLYDYVMVKNSASNAAMYFVEQLSSKPPKHDLKAGDKFTFPDKALGTCIVMKRYESYGENGKVWFMTGLDGNPFEPFSNGPFTQEELEKYLAENQGVFVENMGDTWKI